MRITTFNGLLSCVCFSLIILSGGCGKTGGQSGGKDRIKVIIDTDIGEDIDDILVTAFALSSPEFEVLAITTVDGDVQARSRIARRLTQACGRPEIPVAAGYVRNMPLEDLPVTGSGGVTQGDLAPDESGLPQASPLKADELVASLAEKYPGEVNLLALGSFANLGQFLVRYPKAAGKLKAIVTSGTFQSNDNVEPDWNMRYDPLAAAVIMRSDVRWVIAPSNTVQNAGGLTWDDIERVRRAGLPATDLLARAVDLWKANKPDHSPQPHLADLSVFAYLLGGWLDTYRTNVHITIPPRGVLPGVAVDRNPEGRVLVAVQVPEELGARLHDFFLERILTPPTDQGK